MKFPDGGCDSELESNSIYNAEFLRKGFKTDCLFHVSDVDEVVAAAFFCYPLTWD